MKRSNKGFTFSELLISIGIIGIISALTIPSIVNMRARAIVPNVNRTVSQLETGLAAIINKAQENSPDSTTFLSGLDKNDIGMGSGTYLISNNSWVLFDDGAPFLGIERIESSSGYFSKIKNASGSAISGTNLNRLYKSKKLNTYTMIEPLRNIVSGSEMDGGVIITTLYIDGNGPDNPNRVGEDVFMYDLKNNGHVTRHQ